MANSENTLWVQANRAIDTTNPLIYRHTLPKFVYQVHADWFKDPAHAGYKPTETDEPAASVTIREQPKPAKQTSKEDDKPESLEIDE